MTKKLATAWKPGQSGNPKGKPPGARNKATMMAMAIMEGDIEKITRQVVDAAIGGDMTAARLIIDRLVPPARERPLSLTLPDTSSTDGVSEAADVVLQHLASGDLLPREANVLSGILENRRRVLETQELERRIVALEQSR